MERFLGILIENYAGHFPLWFAPVQAVVATITSDADDYAKKVHADLIRAGLRAELDVRNEKINYKIREHSLQKVPVILVCGKREAEEGSVNIRRLGEKDQKSMSLAAALTALQQEAEPPDVKRQALQAA
jgi:threonyl-tRNA synthetase